ncbi:MAG: hypothetical protein EU529_12845 [Promethearchaeota archaeon]|nr:MAG: hypothetical protein EU529_12845 [Candidatus Lokiarchaeota archaeon]
MIETKYMKDAKAKAFKNFENIKASIKGLYEILHINLNDNDFYSEAASENLSGLYHNILELLINDYGLQQFVKKLRTSEVDLNIVLNEAIAEQF